MLNRRSNESKIEGDNKDIIRVIKELTELSEPAGLTDGRDIRHSLTAQQTRSVDFINCKEHPIVSWLRDLSMVNLFNTFAGLYNRSRFA